ncbi:MAG: hypothetical protein AB7P22_14910, partial [Vicinamibacterales bacterium]
MPNSQHQQLVDLPLQTRLAPITSVDEKRRTAELVWTTGARVKRFDWERGKHYLEELSLDPRHVRLGRLNGGGAPLLNAHSRYTLGDVLGVVEKDSARLAGGRGTATTRFSQREDVEPFFRDVKDKIIVNVSCGYAVYRMEQLPPDDESDGLPVYRAIDWEPMELSLVPIGADAGAGVRAEEMKRTYPCAIVNHKEANMSEQQDLTAAGDESVRPSAAEQRRVRTIRELCRANAIQGEQLDKLLDGELTVAEVRQRILDIKASETERTPIRSGHTADIYVTDRADGVGGDPRRNHIIEGLVARMGGPAPSEPARQFAGMRMLDIARACLEMRGIRTSMMRSSEIARRAMSHSLSDFPALLSESGNRALRAAYQAHMSGITKVFRKGTVPDFRTKNILMLSEGPQLLHVQPGGEITSGSMSETKETYALATYGRILGLTRAAIINDDTRAFDQLPALAGQAAAELTAKTLTTMLHSNPTLSTGNGGAAVFSTTNGNIVTGTGSGAVINVD